jgi:hypothetical protein
MIKRFYFLIILFLFIGTSVARCDTTDHYSIYYNDIKIHDYNINTEDSIPLAFDKTSLKENDNLTVKYWSDTLCATCKYYLVIIDSEKRYVKVVSCTGQGIPLTFSMSEVLNWSNENSIDTFEIYYYEEKPAFPVYLFTLQIKE